MRREKALDENHSGKTIRGVKAKTGKREDLQPKTDTNRRPAANRRTLSGPTPPQAGRFALNKPKKT